MIGMTLTEALAGATEIARADRRPVLVSECGDGSYFLEVGADTPARWRKARDMFIACAWPDGYLEMAA